MESKKTLSEKWKNILNIISEKFNKGDDLDIESVIYLIGVQEFGNPNMKFNKDQKIDLMHIAVCRLLEPYGFYEFDYVDKDGWPHDSEPMQMFQSVDGPRLAWSQGCHQTRWQNHGHPAHALAPDGPAMFQVRMLERRPYPDQD